MYENDNRRLHIRFNADESFNGTTWWQPKDKLFSSLINKHHTALIHDVSQGGCSFLTNHPPSSDDYIGINVSFGEYSSFPLTGRVRQVVKMGEEPTGINNQTEAIYRVSIQYLYCNPRSLDYLKRLLVRLRAASTTAA